jgi:hypothetical protein
LWCTKAVWEMPQAGPSTCICQAVSNVLLRQRYRQSGRFRLLYARFENPLHFVDLVLCLTCSTNRKRRRSNSSDHPIAFLAKHRIKSNKIARISDLAPHRLRGYRKKDSPIVAKADGLIANMKEQCSKLFRVFVCKKGHLKWGVTSPAVWPL